MKFTLIRGLAREQFHWDRFPQYVREAFPECEIEMLDLPGNGKYASRISPLFTEDYIKFLRQGSSFVGRKEPTHILAMSFAAMISQAWAYQYPEELASLVLINTSLRPTPVYQRMRPTGLMKLIDAARTSDLVLREKKILQLTTQLLGRRLKTIARDWGEHAQIQHTSAISTFNQMWTAAQMERAETPPPVPCLILSSERDALVNTKASEDLAQAWGATHRVHPLAGHDLPLDDPKWIVKEMRDFYRPHHARSKK